MNVTKYNVLNKTTNKNLPYYKNEYLVIPNIIKPYKYFLECSQYIKDLDITEYYILFGENKFDENCRRCDINIYNNLKLKPKGEIKEYIEDICNEDCNINISFYESEEEYDVFKFAD